ncbi:hypothetical protein FPHYL_11652 [Fusarium phyllophilum]|uniref:Uncharacterized protein n=1 Tax=Fusarium phyllophilum TaxID=47803 RepID=A0A8H5IWN9_9HYPO|nr:hypothetical protein FPHYL_11652 [Fusarium phyllophilum]
MPPKQRGSGRKRQRSPDASHVTQITQAARRHSDDQIASPVPENSDKYSEVINDPDFLPYKLKTSEINLNLIMTTASAQKPKSGADVSILKAAQQLQHLTHFLSQGPHQFQALAYQCLIATLGFH